MRGLLAVATLSWLLASGAEAQDADAAARAHFQAGTDHFQVADYEAALREYEQAYALSHRPELMYNLYLCHERLGHLDDAASWLERYLDEATEVHRRAMLEQRLHTMRRRLAEAEAQTVDESEAETEDESEAPSGTPPSAETTSEGERGPAPSAPALEAARASLGSPETATPSGPAATAPESDASAGGSSSFLPGIALLVGGGVASVLAVSLGLGWWLELQGEVDRCQAAGARCRNLDDLTVARDASAGVTLGVTALAVAGLLAGPLLLVDSGSEEGDRVACGIRGLSATCYGRF